MDSDAAAAYHAAEDLADKRLAEARSASRTAIMLISRENAKAAIDAWQLWLEADAEAEAAICRLEQIHKSTKGISG